MTCRVLVVDDEPQVLRALAATLAAECDVRTTQDPWEALEMMQSSEVDVVVADQRMPEMEGDELLRRAAEVCAATRILLTGYADVEVLARAVNLGQIYAYIPKPWDPLDLRLTVQRAAEHTHLRGMLAESEKRLRAILRAMPEGVWVVDSGNSVTTTNPRGGEYLRVLTGGGEGKRLERVGQMTYKNLMARWQVGGGVEVATGDDERYFEITSSTIDDEGDERIVVVRDVTLARIARKREEHQSRLAALGQLAGGIAHDFNNLMTVVGLNSQLLLQRDGIPSDARELIVQVSGQVERAEELVTQILAFSRRSGAPRRILELGTFTREVTRTLSRMVPQTVKMEIVVGGECRVVANLTQLQQVLTNLVLNAKDAMPTGVLTIETAPCEPPPDAPEAGPWVMLRVTDQGSGMSQAVAERIFEPYFTTNPEHGAGLGMAQVHGIVTEHGGRIDVSSQKDVGTVVTIYLPGAREAAAVEEEGAGAEESVPRGRGETILVVDDQKGVLQAVGGMLEHLGYRVVACTSGKDALERWRQAEGGMALVLTDLLMPGMSGMELARQLKSEGATEPVVTMTGDPRRADLDAEDPHVPIAARLSKPVRMAHLARTLREILAGA